MDRLIYPIDDEHGLVTAEGLARLRRVEAAAKAVLAEWDGDEVMTPEMTDALGALFLALHGEEVDRG